MSEMGSRYSFGLWNTNYGQKKGRESNWQFDSRPLKVGNLPDFLGWRRRATYRWKALDEGYNFASDRIAIWGLHKKLCALKVAGVPSDGISGLPQNDHLDVVPMEWRRVYYKGEGGGFPQVQVVVNLVCPGCPWLILALKVFQLCTNHLVLALCRFVWVNKACHIFLVPSRSSSMPFYPSIMLRARERALTPCPFVVFCLGLTFESRKELGVRHILLPRTNINTQYHWMIIVVSCLMHLKGRFSFALISRWDWAWNIMQFSYEVANSSCLKYVVNKMWKLHCGIWCIENLIFNSCVFVTYDKNIMKTRFYASIVVFSKRLCNI
jgi:hypothetical protein